MKNFHIRNLGLLALIILLLISFGCTKKETDTSVVDRINHGVSFLEQGEYRNAITEFEAALRADPNNFDAMKNLAGAYAFNDDWETARDRYIDAKNIRPGDKSIYVNLSYVYMQLNDFDLAWDNIARAGEIDPDYPLLHYRAGELFRAQGQEDEAVAAFQEYLLLEPNSRLAEDAEAILATLNPSLVEGAGLPTTPVAGEETETPESESEITEEIIEEEPAVEEVAPDEETTEEESVDEESEVVDEVTEDVEETADEETADEEAADEEATDETENGEEEVVVPDLPELTGDALYQDRLSRGRQMRAIGSSQAAIRLLIEAYEVHPDYAVVNYELGMAYLIDGQNDSAKFYLERYIELETDPELIADAQARLDAIAAAGSNESDDSTETSSDTTEDTSEETTSDTSGDNSSGQDETEEESSENEGNFSFF